MKKNTKHHKPYPGLKGHFKTYVNHSLKSFEKYLRSSKLSNWHKDQLMTTHIILINYLEGTFKNDPGEMTHILMDTRINQINAVKQSNLKNNPYHYSGDDQEEWDDFK